MAILDLLGAALTGGMTSIVGLGVQHYMDYKKQKLQNEHDVSMHSLNMLEMKQEAALADQQGKQVLAAQREKGAIDNLTAAIASQANMMKGASQWVVNICALTRPVLTLLLDVMTIVIIFVNPTHALASEIVYMASTATTYWFGDRARKK